MDDGKKFWICSQLAGLGPARMARLLEICGNAEEIFNMPRSELLDAGIPKNVAEKILQWESLPWEKEIEFCRKNDISAVTLEDPSYPPQLKQIFDPPIILYVKGSLPEQSDIPLAIVGTRNPSIYGIKMAEKFASELSCCGFLIVSGLARGVDTAAHKGALKAGGKTIAVTGCGFKQCYPKENASLAGSIAKAGAVITEFVSDTPPEPQNFPRRNRIISGLSKGVLVIEAGQKSGALITAHLAVEQGREVFALPGRIDALSSKGANQLLKEGAALVESVEEILEILNLEMKKPAAREEVPSPVLTAEEQTVFKIIEQKCKATVDELLAETEIGRAGLFQILLNLTIKDLVKELPGKIYTKKGREI